MEHCDVVIVGGGPGGSSCAKRLSGAGLDVVVLDKAVFPRDKVCAGWITPAVLDELELDPADYAQGRVLQPITAFHVGRCGGPMIDLEYRAPVSYGIRRCEFDHYLLNRCGARLQLGESVRSIARARDGWVIDNRYRTPMLVGAGGHFCPVARWAEKTGRGRESLSMSATDADPHRERLSPTWKETPDPLAVPVVAAQEIEFLLDDAQQAECKVEGRRPELYFCRDLLGYGWCFRKGNYLNVGLGREDRDQLPERVADFCEHLQQQGRIPRCLPGMFRGHAYLLYDHSPREVVGDGVLLVGDAAGLAYTKSGEGIRPAIESGLLAADVILAAGGNYGRATLEPYRARLESRFGRRRPPCPPARSASSRLRRLIAAILLANRWFVRHVVIQRWFLHWDQPPLRRDPLFFRPASA